MTQKINIKYLLLNEGFGVYEVTRHGCYTDYEIFNSQGVYFNLERISYRNQETRFALNSESPMVAPKGNACYDSKHEGIYRYCLTQDGEYNTRLTYGELKEALELNK